MSNPRLASAAHKRSRRTEATERVGEILTAIARFLLRDRLSTFLLVASLALLVTFFSLLGSLSSEGSGRKVALSAVTGLASGELLRSATLLDYDHQVVVETKGDLQLYADYPGSDAATQELLRSLSSAGTRVEVNPQSGKEARVIVVQFLIPILLLVCLFSFFMRQVADDSGGIGAFSAFGGKGKRRKKGEKATITFDSVAGAGEALAELKEIRDFLDDPSKYLAMGAAAPRACSWSGLRGRARRYWRGPPRERPTPPSSRPRAPSSSSPWSGSARPVSATSSPRPASRPPRSSSLTSSTPPGASAAPGSARATTSASRP